MRHELPHAVCWVPTWNTDLAGIGLEHVLLTGNTADSSLLAVDEDAEPFRLSYRLRWDDQGLLRQADLEALERGHSRTLSLRIDGDGRWLGMRGEHLDRLDGCTDIDIWPTPMTNSFPIWRSQLKIGERREFRIAWVRAPDLTVEAVAQAYTRLRERVYLFESLEGSGFEAELPVDEDGLVTDYPDLFRRVRRAGE